MRLPRLQHGSRVSVRSLTRQLDVGKATAHDLAHRKSEAIFVRGRARTAAKNAKISVKKRITRVQRGGATPKQKR
jgi:predicted transcriptional regulator